VTLETVEENAKLHWLRDLKRDSLWTLLRNNPRFGQIVSRISAARLRRSAACISATARD
jgi:hypothetical protein